MTCSFAQFAECGGGVEFAFEVAFEGLAGKAAQIGSAVGGPVFGGQGGYGRLEDATGEGQRFGAQDAAAGLLVVRADQAVGPGVKPGCAGAEGFAAQSAVGERGHPAKEAGDPEGKIGNWHPDAAVAGLFEDGEDKAKDGFVRIVIGQRLFENFGIEGKSRGARVVYRIGEWGREDFTGVEADQILLWPFDVTRVDQGHGFERSAEAAPRFGRRFGDATDSAVAARE